MRDILQINAHIMQRVGFETGGSHQQKIFGEYFCAMGQGDSEHLLKVTAQHTHDVMQCEDRVR